MAGRQLEQLELYSIAEKDELYYKRWIGDDVQEITQRLLGVRRWLKYRNAIDVLARFGYFGTSTLAYNPTPGEEFVEAKLGFSSISQRALMILLKNEFPLEINRSLGNLIKDIHYITFYLFGDFYELAKRAVGISYTTADTNLYQSQRIKVINKIIGLISLLKLIISLPDKVQSTKAQQELRVQKNSDESSSTPVDPSIQCQLCSEQRTNPTSTLCGHIFCWICIHQWLKDRGECPICRSPTEPSRLIHLLNFR